MRSRLWIIQLPMIALFAWGFWVSLLAERGDLRSEWLRNNWIPITRTVQGAWTDLKFRHFRGPQVPRNKIVIVAIDDEALNTVGRWPWHREVTAQLIDKLFTYQPRVVGLDITFSEPEERIPTQLATMMKNMSMGEMVDAFDSDRILGETIARNRDRLVLGWFADACQPALDPPEQCPILDPEVLGQLPQGLERSGIAELKLVPEFNPLQTPLISLLFATANIPSLISASHWAGTLNGYPDADGVIRRTPLVILGNDVAYPSIALAMARVGLGDDLAIAFDQNSKISEMKWIKGQTKIPISPLGTMEINFRGPAQTFRYLSAVDLMSDGANDQGRAPASEIGELLRDAYVLVGVTATAVHDIRAFPFDRLAPGVEGHANILDNILSHDPMLTSEHDGGNWIILILMVFGAVGLGALAVRMESIPALTLFGGLALFALALDGLWLFGRGINWNTGLLHLEYFSVFVVTIAAKYVLEESDRKFLKSAFGKYVAPAMVDTISKDPKKLALGGERKELSILFSDIRGFTSFSEAMDARSLAKFLNDYLGEMTAIIFKHNGTVDKFIGDAIMAFWGAPLDLSTHASAACQAAREMQQAVSRASARFKEQFGVDIKVGIGINTGAVSVGNMGSENNFNYTVIGDHVNLASRVEGLTKSYGVSTLTTRFTLDAIKASGAPSLPPHRLIDCVQVKGKKDAVDIIEILDWDPPTEGLEAFARGRKHYLKREWDEAILEFEKSAKLLARTTSDLDTPSLLLAQRAQEFKLSPPDADWIGSWEMKTK